jgi:hypothetical protein
MHDVPNTKIKPELEVQPNAVVSNIEVQPST